MKQPIRIIAVLLILLPICTKTLAQAKLQPGFDAKEYASLLSLAFYGNGIPDSNERKTGKDIYTRQYTSPEVGLKNQWSLYLRNDNVAVIDIRGTVGDMLSWTANFYAAMIPASGTLQLNDSTSFRYRLSADTLAAVHVGWTVALASMAPDIVAKIKEVYARGIRDICLIGHSQGGAITFLLRSYLHYLQEESALPRDILFKTYCSAAPKPGNMHYAYDFDYITRGGWAYTVVNRSDWVPETPYTIQRIQDMNAFNPLIHTKELLKKQSFLVRLVGGIFYGKANRKPRKAQQMYTHYLGKTLYKRVVKNGVPGLKEPEYVPSSNYMRAGNPIILMPDEEYRLLFKENGKDYFVHHQFAPYYFLIKKQYLHH